MEPDICMSQTIVNSSDPYNGASFPGSTDTFNRHQSLPVLYGNRRNSKDSVMKQAFFSPTSDNQIDMHSEAFGDDQITLDRPPTLDNYSLTLQALLQPGRLTRPSVVDLMHGARETAIIKKDLEKTRENIRVAVDNALKEMRAKNTTEKIDFFQGVFIPVFTNIVGALLYLRNSWVAGHAGIIAGIGTVLLSTIVISITAVSLCGICSNGQVKKGGLYYLVSRSLGPEFGGSIGMIFSIANAMMASLYIVSVAETISDLLLENDYGIVTNTRINDIRLFGIVVCLVLMLITFAGNDIEQSFTLFMFSLYFLSFFNWCVGSLISPNEEQRLKGMTGYSLATISENLLPLWRNENFISVFAVIFPGMTGLMAGSMALDKLRDPPRDVPLGMFTAIGVCSIFNLIAVFISGATMLRDVSGHADPQINNESYVWHTFECTFNETCKYGLMNYFQVAKLEALWAPLIYAGIFAMSLSSTMTNLDNGPQIFQAMCKDQLFPLVKYFSKEYDLNTPQRAYIFFSTITMGIVLIGDLNVINGLVSNLFLAVYASVNYACFDASFAKTPGFRPSFRFYNMWLSLGGAGICIIVMFIISWIMALFIFAFFFVIFIYLSRRRVEVNWGSSTQANSYRIALTSMLKLSDTEEHVKNYRPQILLMIGNPAARSSLLDFASSITKGDSLLIAAHVVPYPPNEQLFRIVKLLDVQITAWLKAIKRKAFYMPFANQNLRSGAQHLFQLAGLGKLRPNILLIGFKNNWNWNGFKGIQEVNDYVGLIRDAFENNLGVAILRNGWEGFDLSETLLELNVRDITEFKLRENKMAKDITITNQDEKLSYDSYYLDGPSEANSISFGSVQRHVSIPLNCLPQNSEGKNQDSRKTSRFFADSIVFNLNKRRTTSETGDRLRPHRLGGLLRSQKKLLMLMNKFNTKRKNGRIDVWWLYDDGGLTLLIPHLLRLPKSYLEGARLRVFTLASSQALQVEERNMAALLTKFRIEFNDLQIIPDITRRPHPETINCFEKIIEKMHAKGTSQDEGLITGNDITTQVGRTYRQLRTRELLLKHSHDADLIVVTLPVPRIEICSSLYMAWLEAMTKDLPPTLLIRGNHTSVLTFYS